MVAGATGIDLFLLVIAADDGVMPQTREHVAIIELLGVRDGVVALTKADLVDDELLELAEDDVREFLQTTPYAGVELVTVSARDGRGLDELLAALERCASRVKAGRRDGPARLPVDRVFPLKGIGTVVTGTLWRGELRAGDPVVVVPGGVRTAVRSVQVHDHEAEVVHAGSRVGVNLRGLDRDEVERGCLARRARARRARRPPLRRLGAARARRAARCKAGDRVRLHHGTAQYQARIAPLEGREIAGRRAGRRGRAARRRRGRRAARPLHPARPLAGRHGRRRRGAGHRPAPLARPGAPRRVPRGRAGPATPAPRGGGSPPTRGAAGSRRPTSRRPASRRARPPGRWRRRPKAGVLEPLPGAPRPPTPAAGSRRVCSTASARRSWRPPGSARTARPERPFSSAAELAARRSVAARR